MSDNVALIIIYNHQYNKNIEILEKLYSTRFNNIYHLVPFYNGDKSNVIPVYDCSYYFQGYVAQGFKHFFKDNYVHYIFIADDLILNPSINQNNYAEHFKLNPATCFLPEFITLHHRRFFWPRVSESFHYNINVAGVEAKDQIPDYDSAKRAFKYFGLEVNPLDFNQIWKAPSSIKDWARIAIKDTFYLFRRLLTKFHKKKYNLSYPLVGSYADIFVVSSDAIKQFCHYCGVFSATKLHVEIAVATAMVLTAKDINTEKELQFQGKALWPDGFYRLNNDINPALGDYKELEHHHYNLKNLLNNFPENYLYLHPIKLSKWNTSE